MLRRACTNAARLSSGVRCLYIPTRTKRANSRVEPRLSSQDKDLDLKLQELREKEAQVRLFLKRKQEQEHIAKIVAQEKLRLDAAATDDDIALLEADLNDTQPDLMNVFNSGLPKSIEQRLGNSAVALLDHDWDQYIQGLQEQGGFKDLPAQDVESFVSMIEFNKKKGARFTHIVEEMASKASISTPTLTHNLMSGYATLGSPEKVEELAKTVRQTPIVYGHLAKAYFKCRDFNNVAQIIRRMDSAGLQPTTPIYTMAVQSLVQHGKFKDAFTLFDNLKYLSTESQPDTKMYNTMILAAAKMHNVNKALDLYQEMISRPINPLDPDHETLNHLIFACSRDETTRTRAWDFFLEQRKNGGGAIGTDSMKALIYLCGETGELMLQRKLISQLSASPSTYPDDFMINCLFLSYLNYDPSRVSALSSSVGPRVRAQLLENVPVSNDEFTPPFLPVDELNDEMIVAEAHAMLQFFSEKSNHLTRVTNLASASFGAPIIYNLLKIALKRGTFDDFVNFWHRYTKRNDVDAANSAKVMIEEEVSHCPAPEPIAVARNQDTYRLGIKAASRFRNMEFGNRVWVERGEWRKSAVFKSLPGDVRNRYDIGFARDMVALFCECGDTESALRVVQSSSKMFRWRRVHLQPLLDTAAKQEDFETVEATMSILRRYYSRETKLTEINEKNSMRNGR